MFKFTLKLRHIDKLIETSVESHEGIFEFFALVSSKLCGELFLFEKFSILASYFFSLVKKFE